MFKFDFVHMVTRISPPAENVLKGGFVFAFLLTVLQAGVYFFVHDESTLAAINDLSAVVSSLAAAWGMAYGAIYSYCYDRRLGSAWGLFALAMGMWVIGDALWAV